MWLVKKGSWMGRLVCSVPYLWGVCVPWTARGVARVPNDDTDGLSVEIPREKVSVHFSRASGPGGQNVNKLNTKVDVRFVLAEAEWLPQHVRERFACLYPQRINKAGEVVVTCMTQRTQHDNLKGAFRLLQQMLYEAAHVPKERIPTEPPAYAKERRLQEKRLRSLEKTRRRAKWEE